jgi:hypothetical protein
MSPCKCLRAEQRKTACKLLEKKRKKGKRGKRKKYINDHVAKRGYRKKNNLPMVYDHLFSVGKFFLLLAHFTCMKAWCDKKPITMPFIFKTWALNGH